ncbi:MAG: PAS domain S-box protein [Candidatus Polarisedimenticolaceae bacterium]|nr:PAS domain S-box protein [Candidatus Polarisedimenticolaceae bacterium]
MSKQTLKEAQAQAQTEQAFHAQKAISEILHISLEPITLEEQLHKVIKLLIAIPWLSVQGKGAIFLYNEQEQQLEMKAQHGLAEILLTKCARFPIGHCLCGTAAKTRATVFKGHLDNEHTVHFEGMPDHGHYCLPIISREKMLGVLNVYVDAGHERGKNEEGFLSTVADTLGGIIERATAERELHYQKFAMDQHVDVSITDVTGKIIYVNDRFCKCTGYSRDELVGEDHSILKSSHHPDSFFKEIQKTVTAGEVWHGEICNRTKNSSLIWLDTTIVPFLNPAGKPYKYVSIHSNITALKEAEEALAKEGALLQNLTHSIGDGLIAGDGRGRVTFINAEARTLIGCEEDLIGSDIHDIAYGCMVERALAEQEGNPILRALHGFRTYREEDGVFHRQDGTTLPIAFVVSSMIDDSGYAGSIAVFRDITSRKAIEQKQQALIDKLQDAHTQLLQSEKMASIGQLAAGVAHEINNPVGYINSNMSTLRRYVTDIFTLLDGYKKLGALVPKDDPIHQELQSLEQTLDIEFLKEDIQSLLAESDEGIHRVKQIVNDLKDFSRLDSTEWHWANLESGLDSTLNIVHNEIKYKADVVKEYAGIPQIECIGSQLNQVFMNLMVNGAHAIKEHGTITIRTGTEGDDWVWIEIADTGAGIDPEVLSRIFDPFFTTKPVGKGTGLGLSLSYSIIKRHGGKIKVESELGKGTCFKVRLPIKQPEKTENEELDTP